MTPTSEESVESVAPAASWKKLLPWVVAAALIAFTLSQTTMAEIQASLTGADWGLFWGTMFGLYLVLFAVDSACVWWVYRRYHVPEIRFADVWPARGASYLLGILNYAAGSAAMAVYFKRRFNVGIIAGGASLLLLMVVDLGLVILAVLLGGSALPPEAAEARPWILAIGAAFGAGALGHLVFWRATWSWGPLERIRDLPQLKGFREATVLDYAKLAIIRAPVTAIYIAMHVLTLKAFGIEVPFVSMLVYVPIQMLVAAIPISPSGLGTVQAVQLVLYASYATEAQIVPYGLALAFGFNIPRMLLGLLCLRPAEKAMALATPQEDAP
ncbi:MAG: uncharacterized membrane protein YbhN (UPF0104 family) [Bradymonadia bacterium]|jgi:uncharacterized membrane protein YbhN (UPF0104 family)